MFTAAAAAIHACQILVALDTNKEHRDLNISLALRSAVVVWVVWYERCKKIKKYGHCNSAPYTWVTQVQNTKDIAGTYKGAAAADPHGLAPRRLYTNKEQRDLNVSLALRSAVVVWVVWYERYNPQNRNAHSNSAPCTWITHVQNTKDISGTCKGAAAADPHGLAPRRLRHEQRAQVSKCDLGSALCCCGVSCMVWEMQKNIKNMDTATQHPTHELHRYKTKNIAGMYKGAAAANPHGLAPRLFRHGTESRGI